MINIVLVARDRRALTNQCIGTLLRSHINFTLTIIDDGSEYAFTTLDIPEISMLRIETSKGIVGQAKNLGVYWTEKYFGRGEWLYLTDNDTAFLPGWAQAMTTCMARAEDLGCKILGGCRHPFHQPNAKHIGWVETDAVAGYSMLMRWSTWDQFGPFDAHAVGIGQSEDFALCRKVVEAGYKVGYITPSVVSHCGITTWDGKPAVGAEHFERMPGFIYE